MIGTGVGGTVTIGCGVYGAGLVVVPGRSGVPGAVGCGCAGAIGALLGGVARAPGVGTSGGLTVVPVGGGETGG